MKNGRFAGRVALVTGAGSGIGRATALAFAREGADLIVCDMNEKTLDDVASAIKDLGRSVMARKVDVASAAEMQAFADEVHASHEAVDVLVNNAGVALVGGLLDTPLEGWSWLLGINVMGVVHGCHFFVPRMAERRRGHVVNIASAAGFMGTRLLVAYCTSKFAVVGLSESLRAELRDKNIGVTAICPGFIKTNIGEAGRRHGRYASDEIRDKSRKLMDRAPSPELVADRILHAVEKNIGVLPVTPESWFIHGLKRVSPTAAAAIYGGIEKWIMPSE